MEEPIWLQATWWTLHYVLMILGAAIRYGCCKGTQVSLRSLRKSLHIELWSIATAFLPIFGSIQAGYVMAGFRMYFPWAAWRRSRATSPKSVLLFFFFVASMFSIQCLCTVPFTLLKYARTHDITSIDFSSDPVAAAAMSFALRAYLMEANRQVEHQKQKLEKEKRPIPAEQSSLHARLQILAGLVSAAVALSYGFRLWVIIQVLERPSSWFLCIGFWYMSLAAFALAFDSMHALLRNMFQQIENVHANKGQLEGFLNSTLGLKSFGDEMHPPMTQSLGAARDFALEFELDELADFQVADFVLGSNEEELETPKLLTGTEGEIMWWREWHFIRTDFLDEQFGLDALLYCSAVIMAMNVLQLCIFWLVHDLRIAPWEVLCGLYPVLVSIVFGAIILYLSYFCIEVNEIYMDMLKQFDILITWEWRTAGSGRIAMLRDVKASVEAEGPPHTFLGFVLSWRLVVTIVAPLLLPVFYNVMMGAKKLNEWGMIEGPNITAMQNASDRIQEMFPFVNASALLS